MSKPFYHLDEDTTHTIVELYEKAKEINLGNVNFSYYATSKSKGVSFFLTEYKSHWDLVVKQEDTTDIYKIIDGSISYDYSERS